MAAMNIKLSLLIGSMALVTACNNGNNKADAYGNFEATEILVSAETNGTIQSLRIEEGDEVKKGQRVGYIDTTQLYLKKKQLLASIEALKSKLQDIKPQIDVLQERKANLHRELTRLQNLKKDGAATQKQIDDMQGEVDVVNRQITATKTQLGTQNAGINSEITPLQAQIDQINDQLENSYITMPQKGRILTKYAEEGEFTAIGKPIVKLADLSRMDLRVYVSEQQLSQIKVGQKVTVNIDGPEDMKSYEGTLNWVASEAEFTPKIVQTKEERVNLVYAAKISVMNDGSLKIGMPAEVNFNNSHKE